MEKKPLTMQQKYRIFNIGRIIGCGLMIFGILMDGLQDPLTWIGAVLVIGVTIFRVIALRCPECDELIVSNFGVLSRRCEKCCWKLGQEIKPEDEKD